MASPGNVPIQYPGGRKSLWGAGAFVAGYLLTYLLVGLRFESTLRTVTVGGQYSSTQSLGSAIAGSPSAVPDPWQGAGSFFYGAHMVASSVPLPSGLYTDSMLVTGGGGLLLALVAVPPLLLVTAGYMATRSVSHSHDFQFDLGTGGRTRYAWNAALTTVFGYMPLAIVGIGVFSMSNSLQPNPLAGWVVAGMIYPVVFGAIGGLVAHRLGDYESGSTDIGGIHDRADMSN